MLPVVMMTKNACKGTGTSFLTIGNGHHTIGRRSSRDQAGRR